MGMLHKRSLGIRCHLLRGIEALVGTVQPSLTSHIKPGLAGSGKWRGSNAAKPMQPILLMKMVITVVGACSAMIRPQVAVPSSLLYLCSSRHCYR